MADRDPVRNEVEQIIRTSEILAVARALRAGNQLRVGQSIDYFIEPASCGVKGKIVKSGKPYRVPVEQWHLDEASRMLERWKADPEKKHPMQRV